MQKKVLVVDDEPGMRELLKERFEAVGFPCVTAANGQEAIRIAKEEQPNLVILDLVMPGLDGYETYRVLKSLPETRDAKIVVYTAQDHDAVMNEGVDALDILDFVVKPVDLDSLTFLVKKTLNCL